MIAAALPLFAPVAEAQAPQRDGGRLFAMVDTNGDGKLDKAEVTKMLEMRAARRGDAAAPDAARVDAFIKMADTNHDGALDKEELAAVRKAREAAQGAN